MSCRESEGRQERRVAARVREVAERDAGRCQRGRGSLRSKSRRGKWFEEAQRACVAMRLYCCVFDGRKGACVAVRVPGVPRVPCLRVSQGRVWELGRSSKLQEEKTAPDHSKTCFAAGEGGWSVEDRNS